MEKLQIYERIEKRTNKAIADLKEFEFEKSIESMQVVRLYVENLIFNLKNRIGD